MALAKVGGIPAAAISNPAYRVTVFATQSRG
jgi:hypothetical protein